MNYASVKAAGGHHKSEAPHPNTVALLKQIYPDFYFFANEFHKNRGIEAEINAWESNNTIDPESNLVLVYWCGTDMGHLFLDTDLTVQDVESSDIQTFHSCDYPQFEAAVQICPVPKEWLGKPFSEYVKSHVKSWEKKLLSDVELKITHLLCELITVTNNYKERFSTLVDEIAIDSFNESFMGEPYIVLRSYLQNKIPFHIIGRIGNNLVLAFRPSIFTEGSDIIADYLLSFGVMDIHSFFAAIAKDMPKGFSCYADWFVFDYEPKGKNSKLTIRLCSDPDYQKGKLPIAIPEMVKPDGWYSNVDIINDKKAMDDIQSWLKKLRPDLSE